MKIPNAKVLEGPGCGSELSALMDSWGPDPCAFAGVCGEHGERNENIDRVGVMGMGHFGRNVHILTIQLLNKLWKTIQKKRYEKENTIYCQGPGERK